MVFGAGYDIGPYLHSSSHSEDAVVGFLRWQALDGEGDLVGLFGDQIIGAGSQKSASVMLDFRELRSIAPRGKHQRTGDQAVCSQRHWRTNWPGA